MIQIDKITGGYGTNILFEDTSITLYPNMINGIIGKSGIGKSTLLYIIGLLKLDISFAYTWGKMNIDTKKGSFQANIRRKDIGYLLQNKELISDRLRLIDNIHCMYAMVSKEYRKSEIDELKKQLKLEGVNFNRYPKSLSGGERQRFALLLALLKKPKLLLCDEPTSALDKKSSIIFIHILKELSKQGVIVVIASHDESIIREMDVIYEIKNRQLNLIKRPQKTLSDIKVSISKDTNKVSYKFYKYYNKHQRSKYTYVFTCFLILILCLLSLLPSVFDIQKEEYLMDINHVSKREFLIVNTKASVPNPQYIENVEPFLQDDIQMIKGFDHIEKVVDFFQLYAFTNSHSIIINDREEITINNKNDFVIQPYITKNDETTNYISSEMAKLFNLKDGDNLDVIVSLYSSRVENIKISIENIKIQEKNRYNPYSDKQKVIYMPNEILLKTISISDMSIPRKALLIETDSIENIEGVMNEINVWLPQTSMLYNLKDIEAQLESINVMKKYLDFSYIASVIIGILFIIINEFILLKIRIPELNNLMINGMQKTDLYKLLGYEKCKQLIYITISGVLILIVCSNLLKLPLTVNMYVVLRYLLMVFAYGVFLFVIAMSLIINAIKSSNISWIMRK